MKLSTRSRYGLRMMYSLAIHPDPGPLQLSEISKRERISEKYLGQIVIHLRAAGLVTSVRGAQGGYFLSRPPENITVLQIVECLEGDLSIVDCTMRPQECSRESVCAAVEVWSLLSRRVRETLADISLADMVAMQREKTRKRTFIV